MRCSRTTRATLAATLLLGACDPYERTTEIRMRDPSQVVAKDVVSKVEVATTPTSTSDLLVTSARRDDGSIVTEWQTRMPLLNGERHQLMDPKGSIVLEDHVPVDVSADDVTLSVCGTVASHWSKSTNVGYDVRPAYPCALPHMTEVAVTTPRSNILAIDHVSTNNERPFAIFGAVVATAVCGTLGSVFLFADLKNKDGTEAGPAPKAVGGVLLGLGGVIDIALLPAIFAPNRRERVFPGT